MIQTVSSSLGQEIQERARALDRRLRADPFYERFLAGEVERDVYAAWLAQLHKYVRFTVPGEEALATAARKRTGKEANARALRAYAEHEAEEERGHDALLISDLAVLWQTSEAEALERVEREPGSPSVESWAALARVMHARYPEGIIGFGMALETLAALESDETRLGLLERSSIPGIERAVTFLEAHGASVEGDHAAGGAAIANALRTPEARAAALFYADVALAMFESIVFWLGDRFAGDLASVGPTAERV
jgi:hypothetical protein